MEFVKYQGIGNDYLVYDVIKNEEVLTREQIKKICDRNFGVGADGILAGPYLDEEKKIRVRVFNSDGSEAERAKARSRFGAEGRGERRRRDGF